MATNSAEEMDQRFAEAFNSGRIDSILAMYESQATLAGSSPEQTATGLKAIRRRFEPLLVGKGRMTIETRYCFQVGDVALLRAKWHLTTPGPDGNPVDEKGNSVEVVRRQPDGRWLYIIDHPFGAD